MKQKGAISLKLQQEVLNAPNLDPISANIYNLMGSHYIRMGFKGGDNYARSLESTKLIAKALSETNQAHLIKLNAALQSGTLTQITLDENLRLIFTDKSNQTITSIDLTAAYKRDIAEKAKSARDAIKVSIPTPEKFTTEFRPLKQKKLHEEASFSVISGLKQLKENETPPAVIEEQFRHLSLCSGYALDLLKTEYGEKALTEMGLISWGDYPDAWDIKDRLGANLQVGARIEEGLKNKNWGPKKDQPFIENFAKYQKSVGKFYELVDQGNEPALITAFQTNTKFWGQILRANRHRTAEDISLNSHVILLLGRQPRQSITATKYNSLTNFIKEITGANKEFLPHLQLEVTRQDGSRVTIDGQGRAIITKDGKEKITTLGSVRIRPGDTASWADVMVTDYLEGHERVMGLARYASQRETILQEFITLPKPKEQKQQTIGVFQVEEIAKAGTVKEQIINKLQLDPNQWEYYLSALAEAGINLNKIKTTDVLPIFDMFKIKADIDKRGGPWAARSAFIQAQTAEHQKRRPEELFLFIQPSDTPEKLFKPLFENHFAGQNKLNRAETAYLLAALDDSIPNINLQETPPRFHAGEVLYLHQERVREIVNVIYTKQAEQFNDGDLTKIIEKNDRPEAIAASMFNETAPSELRYETLEPVEQAYILKALDACSPDLDLNLERRGKILQFKNFKVGDRAVLRRADLQQLIKDIQAKKIAQGEKTLPEAKIKDTQTFDQNQLPDLHGSYDIHAEKELKVPPSVSALMDKVYPANTLENRHIRNLTALAYLNEQARGGLRSTAKSVISNFTDLKSVGLMQLRPTSRDIELSSKLLTTHGLQTPTSVEELKRLVEEDNLASIIIAGERIRDLIANSENFTRAFGDRLDLQDKDTAIQILTAYNRSFGATYRTSIQVNATNLAAAANIKPDVEKESIDALLNEPGAREKIEAQVILTFQKVCEEIQKTNGDLPANFSADLAMIFKDKFKFLQSATFKKINYWYTNKTGKKLHFILDEADREQGNQVFSYGIRMIQNDNIAATFNDPKTLKNLITKMEAPYEPQLFISAPKITPEEEKQQPPENQAATEINELLDADGNLTFYGKSSTNIKLRKEPRGESIALMYFGSKFKVLGQEEQTNGEVWLKVEVTSPQNKGATGYIAFEKSWFDQKENPKISAEVTTKFTKETPPDYKEHLETYLRFIKNLNPAEVAHSRERMALSQQTARIIEEAKDIEAIKTHAKSKGYNEQADNFFALIPKTGLPPMRAQHLYLIDTASNRIIAFKVSTGKAREETPADFYKTTETGFKTLDLFGGHMGTYRQKFGRKGERAAPKLDAAKGYASMTTGLIPIVRTGATEESEGLYFHGTNKEERLGEKASGGCIRMSNLDIAYFTSLLNGAELKFHVIP